MGKSAQGAIWLNKDKLPVWDFWQFWRNTEDGDVGRFLRLFTELPLEEVERLESLEGSAINDAKVILANEVTALCHSREEAEEAAATATRAFGDGGIAEGLPEVATSTKDISIIDALKLAGLASSNGEARRLIKGGGARVNDTAISSEDHMLTAADFDADGKVKISSGKKRHVLLVAS